MTLYTLGRNKNEWMWTIVRFIIEKSALIKPQDLDCSIAQELKRKKNYDLILT